MSPKSIFAAAAIAALGSTFLIPTDAEAWPQGFAAHEAAIARPAFQASGNQAAGAATAAAPLPRTVPTVVGPSGPAQVFRPGFLTPKGSGNTAPSGGGATIRPIGPGGSSAGTSMDWSKIAGTLAGTTNSSKVSGTMAGATNSSRVSGTLAEGIPPAPPHPPSPPEPPVSSNPTPPAPPVTTGQTNPTPPAPCSANCILPGTVGVSVGGGIVVVQGDTQASPSPRPRERQDSRSAGSQNGFASNVHTSGYQAIALAWNDNGSWVTRRAGSLEDASKIALSICNSQYGTCVLSGIAVKPTSYACMALGHSSVDEKNLVAVTRGTLEEARAAVLEALGAPDNAKLIVYSDCSA